MAAWSGPTPPPLGVALGDAEQVFAVPVIPGELEGWALQAQAELRKLHEAWSQDGQRREAALQEILDEDLELAQQVQQLRGRLGALSREVARLSAAVDRLVAATATSYPKSSWQPLACAERCRDRVLIWVVRARSFGPELETWQSEAIYRVRGELD